VALNSTLKENSRGAVGSGKRFREALIIAEVAVALVLLVAAGLLVNSFIQLSQVKTGLNSPATLTFEISLPDRIYGTDPQRIAFYDQLLERVRAWPEVTAAGATLSLPLGGGERYWTTFEREDRRATSRESMPVVNIQELTTDYLRAAGVPIIAGRDIAASDGTNAPKVALISAALAKRYFQNEDPLGKRVRTGIDATATDANAPWFTVVGVAGDITLDRVTEEPPPIVYVSHAQGPGGAAGSMVVAVRSAKDPVHLTAMIRGELRALDKNLPIGSVATMQQALHEAMGPARTNSVLLATFAGLALFLAAIGVFGALSYLVAQRTAEIGLRKALGAPSLNIFRLIVWRGLVLALTGAGIGLAAAFSLTHLMRSLLYGVSPMDPVTIAAVTMMLLLVAFIACTVPARRAIMIEPCAALREE
jgi:putative ABC transport system permease protein